MGSKDPQGRRLDNFFYKESTKGIKIKQTQYKKMYD